MYTNYFIFSLLYLYVVSLLHLLDAFAIFEFCKTGMDRLTFAMSCAVLLRVARCQYLYRAEFLGSTGIHTEILDATAFGALCREKLAPLYLHMMSQLGVGPEGKRGEEETNCITVEGATYLLNRSKIACQRNQPIHLIEENDERDTHRNDKNDRNGRNDRNDRNALNVSNGNINTASSPIRRRDQSMVSRMMKSARKGRSSNSNSRRGAASSRKATGSADNQSWEDVVRELRNANDIADGLLVTRTPQVTPHTTPNRMNDLNKFDSAGMEEDEEMRIQLQATTDAALQLEVENQELRRRLLESSM